MTLRQWQDNGWLRQHATSPEEIGNLLAIVDRDLRDAGGQPRNHYGVSGISAASGPRVRNPAGQAGSGQRRKATFGWTIQITQRPPLFPGKVPAGRIAYFYDRPALLTRIDGRVRPSRHICPRLHPIIASHSTPLVSMLLDRPYGEAWPQVGPRSRDVIWQAAVCRGVFSTTASSDSEP